jgi:polyphenol oxidase
MLSEVHRGPGGPYLDLSPLFGGGVFAYVTLKGSRSSEPEPLQVFLGERGHAVRAVHRVVQVHSGRVVAPEEAPCDADALVGSAAGEAVRVVTADCVPILLAAADGSRYAAVHAGWKGTMARIVQAAVRAMACDPSSLTAYIGPAVGPCCYGVDGERYGLFAREFPGWLPPAGEHPALDLQALNAKQLEEAGVERRSIHVEERCTSCDLGLCCSYRRDGERAGRMAALIGRTT